ncbi:alpha-tectorin-like [Enoplosus armatus]|uniref:alpha-tectorin-like n=1 Tax=Enoplosus armatus TaxID=215367 RepID=UPI0039969D8C
MLRPLLYLCALIGLAGAQQTITGSSELNISSCPITFYGQKYEQVYVNFTSDKLAVCFNGFFDPQTKQDCIEFETLVNGTTVNVFNVTSPTRLVTQRYYDISGCRHSGVLYKPVAVVSSDPETCVSLICDATAVLSTVGCGPMERCQGNNICILDPICTVTGHAVIDFHGQVNSVQDRCAYTLMSTSLVPDLHVLANFRERRRKDVSFLDSVTLRLNKPDVHIHLEHSGRVRLDNTTLTLSSSAQMFHGVELSKDQAGVTAKVVTSNYTTTVFFDGNTAQIHLRGPAVEDPSLHGLCGNSSSSLSELKLSEYSASGCEMQYNGSADGAIDCNMMTERCNLLQEAPFTACHNSTDPQPFMTACTDTLCEYPAVDGLYCQFLEAYTRACSLHSNDTLEGWRSKAGCSPPQAFCQDKICSDHEFCGETVSGEKGCLCRAIFASPYRSTDTYGDPKVCGQNSASVTLVGCLLEEKGFDYSTLHLNDQTCTGQIDELTHMVTFSFNSSNTCGTVVTTSNSQLIYKNAIMTQNTSSDIIARHDQVHIDFSCFYTQPDEKTVAFRIRDSSVVQHLTSGAWNYTLSMKAYTDAGRTQAVESSAEVQLNQKIWVELEADGLDGGLVAVVTDSCWATNQASPNGSLRYYLIMNGCANAADQTVKVEGNGRGTSNHFSFNMFQFSEDSGDVYLHCKLNLCVEQKEGCAPVCNGAGRRRRSARVKYEDEDPAFISMAWTR